MRLSAPAKHFLERRRAGWVVAMECGCRGRPWGCRPSLIGWISCSATIQEELVQIVERLGHDSLDVERKNHQDRRNAKNHRTTTLARASRNGILREFRTWRLDKLKQTMDAQKPAKKYAKIGASALAVQGRPDLSKRGRGRLHWEEKVSQDVPKQTTYTGDNTALRQ